MLLPLEVAGREEADDVREVVIASNRDDETDLPSDRRIGGRNEGRSGTVTEPDEAHAVGSDLGGEGREVAETVHRIVHVGLQGPERPQPQEIGHEDGESDPGQEARQPDDAGLLLAKLGEAGDQNHPAPPTRASREVEIGSKLVLSSRDDHGSHLWRGRNAGQEALAQSIAQIEQDESRQASIEHPLESARDHGLSLR